MDCGLISISLCVYLEINPSEAVSARYGRPIRDGCARLDMCTRETVRILHQKYPEMIVDGDMQANFALNANLLADNFPFSTLIGKPANTLIFPNLESGNIAYKLLQEMGGAEAVGPILLGLKKPVHVLQLGSSVREIVNMITIAVVDAQGKGG